MATDNNAVIAINGGGFVDPNYNSLGGIPQGTVIKNGKIITNRTYKKTGGIIGFTKDNKLILARMTANEAIKNGVTNGAYSTTVYGETVEVIMSNGVPQTIYGKIPLTLEMLK